MLTSRKLPLFPFPVYWRQGFEGRIRSIILKFGHVTPCRYMLKCKITGARDKLSTFLNNLKNVRLPSNVLFNEKWGRTPLLKIIPPLKRASVNEWVIFPGTGNPKLVNTNGRIEKNNSYRRKVEETAPWAGLHPPPHQRPFQKLRSRLTSRVEKRNRA